jgi:hypothetical protein
LKRALYPRASRGFWSLAYIQGIKEERDVPTPRWDMQQVGIFRGGENERDWRLHHRVANGGSVLL